MDGHLGDTVEDLAELSSDEISALEQVVKNFITSAQAVTMDPLEPILTVMGHSSHLNDGAASPVEKEKAPKA